MSKGFFFFLSGICDGLRTRLQSYCLCWPGRVTSPSVTLTLHQQMTVAQILAQDSVASARWQRSYLGDSASLWHRRALGDLCCAPGRPAAAFRRSWLFGNAQWIFICLPHTDMNLNGMYSLCLFGCVFGCVNQPV